MKTHIKYVGIYVFLLTLPLPLPLIVSSIAFSLMLINLLLLKPKNKLKYNNFIILLFAAFFLVDFLRSFVLLDVSFITFKEVKVSFLIAPVIIYSRINILLKIKKNVFFVFFLGIIFYIIYAWSYAIYFYTIKFPDYEITLEDGYLRYVFYSYLPEVIHHAYLGMYILLSIIIIYTNTIIYQKIGLIKGIFLVMALVLNLFFLGSKSTILLCLLFIGGTTFFAFFNNQTVVKLRKIFILFIIISIAAIFTMRNWLPHSMNSSIEKREVIYTCGFNIFKSNPIWGVGFKNIEKSGRSCSNLEQELITHNMFLNEMVSNGLIGLIILVLTFGYLIFYSIKSKNIIFISFVIMLFSVGMVEDILSRQRGVLFFVFFTALFYFQEKFRAEKKIL